MLKHRLFFSLLLFITLISGCQSSRSRHISQSRKEEQMLAMLSIARSYHRRANIAEQLGHGKQAIQEIDKILGLSFPRGFRAGEEMLLDAWARKAMLLLKLEQPKKAFLSITKAIQRPSWLKYSFYRAHLFHVKGRVLEAQGKPRQALKSYELSIKLNQSVIREIQKLIRKGRK